jgi:hypothetical protein
LVGSGADDLEVFDDFRRLFKRAGAAADFSFSLLKLILKIR